MMRMVVDHGVLFLIEIALAFLESFKDLFGTFERADFIDKVSVGKQRRYARQEF